MDSVFPILRSCPLFFGIEESGLGTLFACLSAVRRRFEKNGFVFAADERADFMGIVLSGAVHVLREDFWGNREILTRVEPGGLFAEAFACADVEKLPVSVMAAEESEILFVNSRRILMLCPSACGFHGVLIRNLARTLAEKNVMLTQKLEHVTRRTTREKLLSYLSGQAKRAGGNIFDIPFSRQELADYLSVDRSALSAELSRMRNEDLLRWHRNHFELCPPQETGQNA
ncbi:MAG: Crp/Fnr family transcriptional regulator [Synergistaceae bacterium]|jgi:CRP-like cAMP-binding protein|nr:Crp/Fnr family transcriptional regulator [Synergistaceae bacterium]